jgi:hypothetical protein
MATVDTMTDTTIDILIDTPTTGIDDHTTTTVLRTTIVAGGARDADETAAIHHQRPAARRIFSAAKKVSGDWVLRFSVELWEA